MTILELALDDQVVEQAARRAEAEGTSVSALLNGWLVRYAQWPTAIGPGLRTEGRLLIATGVLSGELADHREILSERDRKLAGIE